MQLGYPRISAPKYSTEPVGRQCAAPACAIPLLFGRFCGECFADAAKDLAQQIETLLIGEGLRPGSDELRAAMVGYPRTSELRWFQLSSSLGKLEPGEARHLRELTDRACLLVALGGVAALDSLYGEPRYRDLPGNVAAAVAPCDLSLIQPFPIARGNVELAALPGTRRRGFCRRLSRERRFDLGTLAVLLGLIVLVVVW